MDTVQFWTIIEDSRIVSKKNSASQREKLTNLLNTLDAENIQAFDSIFGDCIAVLYTYEICCAAYLLCDFQGKAEFEIFAQAIVAEGQWAYELALENADSLSEWADPSQMLSVKLRSACNLAYRKKTGHNLVQDSISTIIDYSSPDLHKAIVHCADNLHPRLAEQFWKRLRMESDIIIEKIQSAFVKIPFRTDMQIYYDSKGPFDSDDDINPSWSSRNPGEKRAWHQILDKEMFGLHYKGSHFDSVAYHYYLPAFLVYSFKRLGDDGLVIAFQICYKKNADFEHFTTSQLECVRDYLIFCKRNHIDYNASKDALEQKAELWPHLL